MSAASVPCSEPTEFTAEAVERALQQLYYDPDMAQKNMAQKWLAQAQASPQAWHFCWELLGPDKGPNTQFFGASTLHAKISSHWFDLAAEHRESLHSQLIAHVCRFGLGPKMVLTRLCVALASMILQTLFSSWPSAVGDILRAFEGRQGASDADVRHLVLLEVLTVLPEELHSRKLTAESRARLQTALLREWILLCPLIRELLQSKSVTVGVKERALRCLGSWMALGVDLHESQELVQDSLALLAQPELFDTAVETIVGALSLPDWHRCADGLVKLVPHVLGLQEQLQRAVQGRDMETSHGICRIAVALGDTHCRTLLEQVGHWQAFQALVGMILFCTSMPGDFPVDETSSSLTLTFWYTLQDDVMSLETEKQTFYLQLYRPLYFQLVDVLLHKARFPSDCSYETWSAEDQEHFRTYRVDVSDTLMCVYELLGPEMLRKLYDKLGALLTDSTRCSSWQDVEALLFTFQSVAETADVSYSDVIPGLIGLVPLIGTGNLHLAETVLLTLGSLAEWLSDHPVMVPTVLGFVLPTLSDASLSAPAVSALKKICRECQCHLQPHASDILSASQDALLRRIHKNPQSSWLMQALGFLLAALPDDQIPEKLLSLLSPHIQELQELSNQPPSAATKLSTVYVLRLISSLFSTFDLNTPGDGPDRVQSPRFPAHSNPVVAVLQRMFPLIQSLLSEWLQEAEVVEAAWAVFEKSLKTLGHDFFPLVSQLCELIGQLFSAYPQASALDLTAQLVQMFCCEPEVSSIAAVLELVTNITMSLFQHGARDHPDVVESFMQLHTQVLRRKPELYLSEGLDIRVVFYCGILAFKLPETPTLKSTCLLFTELLSHCEAVPAVREVLREDGLLLLQTLLEVICVQASPSLLDHLGDVLFSIGAGCPGLLSARLRDALRPDGPLAPEQRENFCQQVLREEVTRQRMRDVVQEFSLLSRGLQASEEAAEPRITLFS